MNLDYIAGFFDGEGSVSLQFHRMPTCKYGYQFLPQVTITQKNKSILEKIQREISCGRIYPHSVGNGVYSIQIVGNARIKHFINLFLPLTYLKRRQLELLREALSYLHDHRLTGNELANGALPKQNVLRLLDIVEEIRTLNGVRGKRVHDVGIVRKQVEEFDEDTYRRGIEAGWQKRIAPLLRNRKLLTGLTPETLRTLYWEQGASGTEIAKLWQCHPASVYRRMRKYAIPRRTNSQAITRYNRHGRFIKDILIESTSDSRRNISSELR